MNPEAYYDELREEGKSDYEARKIISENEMLSASYKSLNYIENETWKCEKCGADVPSTIKSCPMVNRQGHIFFGEQRKP